MSSFHFVYRVDPIDGSAIVDVLPPERVSLPAPPSENNSERAAREAFQHHLNIRADELARLEKLGLSPSPEFPTIDRYIEAASEILRIRTFQAALHLGDRDGASEALGDLITKRTQARLEARVGQGTAAASAWESLRAIPAWVLANQKSPLAYARKVARRLALRQAVVLEHDGEVGFDKRAATRLDRSKDWHHARREEFKDETRGQLPDALAEAMVAEILCASAADDRQRAMVELMLQGDSADAARRKAGVSGKALAEYRARAAAALQVR